MEWNRSVTKCFIQLYKEKPCLWKICSDEYKNKNLKQLAYNELVEYLKSNGMSDITIKEVKSKIQNIRRMVRKERSKVEVSKRSGNSRDDLYKPTLWYYDLLAFSNDMDPLSSIDNINSTNNIEEDEEDNCDKSLEEDKDESGMNQLAANENINKTLKTIPMTQSKKTKRQRMDDNMCSFMKKCTEALNNTENDKPDEFDALGINIAAKIKKMTSEQQIHAELLIQKICAKGLLGQLNENFDIINTEKVQQISVPTDHAHSKSTNYPKTYFTPPTNETYQGSTLFTQNIESSSGLQNYYNHLDLRYDDE